MAPKPADLRSILLTQRQSLASSGLISLKSSSISSLAKLGPQRKLRILDISKTPIESLGSLESQEILSEIIADDSTLKDFKGLDRHPKLAKFSAISTPLSDRPNFRIACLIVIGPMLSFINGGAVTTAERDQTRPYPKIAKYLLLFGWDLELRDISEDEYKRLAQEHGVKINDKSFEALTKSEIKALFRLPVLPKSKQDVEREVSEYVEETHTLARRREEEAEEKLAGQIADQLGRIGVNVRPGPAMKDEILTALTGLADVVRVLEEVDEAEPQSEQPAEPPADLQPGEVNE
jgi:hypothetical protein